MEGLPQPPDQPSVDGCPIVELQDTAVDLEHLLKALYHLSVWVYTDYKRADVCRRKFLFQPALPFAVVESLVCLGNKYGFREILESTVERITFENPTTLEEFDALIVGGKYIPTRIVPQQGLLFDILRLARTG
jgi:hypothetical protein